MFSQTQNRCSLLCAAIECMRCRTRVYVYVRLRRICQHGYTYTLTSVSFSMACFATSTRNIKTLRPFECIAGSVYTNKHVRSYPHVVSHECVTRRYVQSSRTHSHHSHSQHAASIRITHRDLMHTFTYSTCLCYHLFHPSSQSFSVPPVGQQLHKFEWNSTSCSRIRFSVVIRSQEKGHALNKLCQKKLEI